MRFTEDHLPHFEKEKICSVIYRFSDQEKKTKKTINIRLMMNFLKNIFFISEFIAKPILWEY